MSDERQAVLEVLDSGWLGMGPKTREFEAGLTDYVGARHAVVVNNGTSALLAAYLAHGIGPGTPVLVPTYTFAATVNALLLIGARPILLDCDPETLNVSATQVGGAIRAHPTAKAIVVTDVAGQPPDLDALRALAQQHGLALIEDAAEAFGARYKDRPVGGSGHTTIFSFHIAKPVTTVEGGAIVTNDPQIAERCRLLRSHGEGPTKYVHVSRGLNLRPTDLLSAIGLVQLRKVDDFLRRREEAARTYIEALGGSLAFQAVPSYVTRHARMIFVAFCATTGIRDAYVRWLHERRIDCRVPWPPIHTQPFFASERAGSTGFPGAEQAFGRVISLPIGNGIAPEQIAQVVHASQEFFARSRKG